MKGLLLVITTFILSCDHNENTCNFMVNSKGERVSWITEGYPINLYIHISFEKYASDLRKAANSWNNAIGKKIINISDNILVDNGPHSDGISVVYLMDNWEWDKQREQGKTRLYWIDYQIIEADILINNSFNFDKNNIKFVDMESLLLHELGHLLGLAHNDNASSVMNTYLDYGQIRREIKDVDKESLSCEYVY